MEFIQLYFTFSKSIVWEKKVDIKLDQNSEGKIGAKFYGLEILMVPINVEDLPQRWLSSR